MPVKVQLDLLGEDVERACGESRGSVRMAARTAPADLSDPAGERFSASPALTGRELSEGSGDRGEAVNARSALLGARGGKVTHDAGGLDDSAGARRKRYDRAGAKTGSERSQPLLRERRLGHRWRCPRPEVAADENRPDWPASPARLREELVERRSEVDLVDAGIGDCA
jgi:hypothetical protein